MTESIQTPRYVFALFGRRQSGKSVYLAALRTTRRPQVNGVSVRYVGSLAPILADGTELQDETERKRIEVAFKAASDALSNGRVPPATNISDGIMGHRFEITLPEPPAPGASVRIHVDLYDYAGEFLANDDADQDAAERRLHMILRETDGLLILAETPARNVDDAAHRASLTGVTALGEALARLAGKEPGAIGQAVLLATKWDHQHIFDCNRSEHEPMDSYLQRLSEEETHHEALFREWLATSSAAEQHHGLDSSLRSSFGDSDYRAYPVSAFGESKLVEIGAEDGSKAEVPARVPLASLNLDEPLLFLIERARTRHRATFRKKADKPAQEIGPLPEPAAIIAEHGEDGELLAMRDTLAARLHGLSAEQAAEAAHASSRRKNRNLWFSAILITAAAGSVVAWDANRTIQLEKSVRTGVESAIARGDLESVITARDGLLELVSREPLLPTVRLLSLGYPLEEQETDRTRLAKTECELWADSARRPDFDLARGSERLKSLQGCAALNEALATAHRNEIREGMASFEGLTEPENCARADFVVTGVDEQRTKLQALLDRAPAGAEGETAERTAAIDRMKELCMTANRQANQRRTRAHELDRLDQNEREAQNWMAYLNKLVAFMHKDGETTPDDLQARREEVAHRLGVLPTELESWRQSLKRIRSSGASFESSQVGEVERLAETVSNLPGDLREQKTKLIDKLAEIKRDFSIWNACERFSEVLNIYRDVSENIGSRSEDRIEELKWGVKKLRNEHAVNDYVKDGLDAIEGQIDQVSEVRVESLELSGKLPGGSNAPVAWRWHIPGPRTWTFSEKGPVNDGRFVITARPTVSLRRDDLTVFVSGFQDRKWPAGNRHFALKSTMSLDSLLSGNLGADPTRAKKQISATLYQYEHEIALNNFHESGEAAEKVALMVTLQAQPGVKGIGAEKCQ